MCKLQAGMLSVKANPGFSERSQHNLHITRHEVAQADGKLHATQLHNMPATAQSAHYKTPADGKLHAT